MKLIGIISISTAPNIMKLKYKNRTLKNSLIKRFSEEIEKVPEMGVQTIDVMKETTVVEAASAEPHWVET